MIDPRNITSDAPENCPDCGVIWSHGESCNTGDPAGLDGWEDWRFCAACHCELFYPHKLVEAASHQAAAPAGERQ